MQVLAEAKAIDASKAAGKDTGPLCGLPFAVKDNIDVVGYATVAGTPGLQGEHPVCHSVHQSVYVDLLVLIPQLLPSLDFQLSHKKDTVSTSSTVTLQFFTTQTQTQ